MARSRLLFGQRREAAPSPFLLDLPPEKTEKVPWLPGREAEKRGERRGRAEGTQPSLFALGSEPRERG